MTFEQFYRILMARKLLAIGLFMSIVIVMVGLGLALPKSYTAETAIVVDMKPGPVTGLAQMATMQPSAYMATQVHLAHSDRLRGAHFHEPFHQRLYDATTRPGGCIPGEAAAALLLAPADWTPPQDKDLATVRLPPPVLQRRQLLAHLPQVLPAWGGSPARVLLAGHSAGGHLAAMVHDRFSVSRTCILCLDCDDDDNIPCVNP